jgi:uncharacterized protein (TIGR02118 family)
MELTRRALGTNLLGMTALGTLLAAPLSAADKSAKSAGGRHCLSVYYPWQADAKFDFDYYRDKHLKMMSELYGQSVGKFEVRKGLHKGDGSSPAFVAALTVQILSMEGFDAAGQEHLPKLLADLANFSNITPVGQIEEIVG